jgi:hypothetical protein
VDSYYGVVANDFVTYYEGIPSVEIEEPIEVEEGGSVVITAIGSDPANEALTYAWDLNCDGPYTIGDQTITFSAEGRDGPETACISVKVTDIYNLSVTDDAPIQIVNLPPTIV